MRDVRRPHSSRAIYFAMNFCAMGYARPWGGTASNCGLTTSCVFRDSSGEAFLPVSSNSEHQLRSL